MGPVPWPSPGVFPTWLPSVANFPWTAPIFRP